MKVSTEGRQSPFPVVDINITGTCNLGCKYCYGEDDARGDIARSTLIDALKFASNLGSRSIELCGGEPLAYKDFKWATMQTKNRGFDLILRTNGLLLKRYRQFVIENYSTIGISLDGTATGNHLMRPLKGQREINAELKFQRAFGEFSLLSEAAPDLKLILASVATQKNIESLLDLAKFLRDSDTKIHLWKVYQFVENRFRSVEYADSFSISDETFQRFSEEASATLKGSVDAVFRNSHETDGSCIIVDTRGDVLIGSKSIGNVSSTQADELIQRVISVPEAQKITQNKMMTYYASQNEGAI